MRQLELLKTEGFNFIDINIPLETRNFIYKITNNINNKPYIGKSTQSLKNLIKRYRRDKPKRPITNALKKYGKTNFNFEIIKITSEKELNDLEKYYIKFYNSMTPRGYNVTIGGDGVVGFKWNKLSKQKLSNSMKGKYIGEKNPFYKKKHTLLTIEKIIISNQKRKGSTHKSPSQETIEKIRQGNLKKIPWNKNKKYPQITGELNPNYRKVKKEVLLDLIKQKKNYLYISNYLRIDPSTFYDKLKEFNIREVYDEEISKYSKDISD